MPAGIRRTRLCTALLLSLGLALVGPLVAAANVALMRLSVDTYTNSTSQHKTEVEPDTFSSGAATVAAFQVGRFFDGGSSNVGWATTSNNGAIWTQGFLPRITTAAGGRYDRASDPSVAYDARHDAWLISTLALSAAGGVHGVAVLTSRSTDGGFTWSDPVTVVTGSDLDKNWIVCDNTPTSRFYGHCYTQWDDHGSFNKLYMSTSDDGGLSWGAKKAPRGSPSGLGGQPVVQPDGTVIVPYFNGAQIGAFRSTNGGSKWEVAYLVSNVSSHTVAGGLRTIPLPSAEVDGAGKVYVVWQDCRFRSGCASNDIVLSTSTDGRAWTTPVAVPIDGPTSGVDHFIPGLAVDRATAGANARLGLTYYYYPNAACSASTCQLEVGFVSSSNGGARWSAPTQLAGPMTLSWLPNTNQGRMVGDYISTSFGADGLARGVFAVANAPARAGADCATSTPNCDQAMYAPSGGLATAPAANAAGPMLERNPVAMTAAEHAAANSALAVR